MTRAANTGAPRAMLYAKARQYLREARCSAREAHTVARGGSDAYRQALRLERAGQLEAAGPHRDRAQLATGNAQALTDSGRRLIKYALQLRAEAQQRHPRSGRKASR